MVLFNYIPAYYVFVRRRVRCVRCRICRRICRRCHHVCRVRVRRQISLTSLIISRAFCETIRMTFGVCVCMCVCVCVCVQGISPSITGRILMKLRMDIPVHHAQCV